jgi:hypothetical protein
MMTSAMTVAVVLRTVGVNDAVATVVVAMDQILPVAIMKTTPRCYCARL